MKWTNELIESELKKCIKVLNINRMPSAKELTDIGRNDLHCKISRTKKYSGWAEHLGLELKASETKTGQEYERKIAEMLGNRGHQTERMTTKHPYDLLVNEHVKVDVKVAGPHHHFGSRAHTFRPSKKHPTCDLYMCVALDEAEQIEKVFVIPSKFAQLVTLNIGTKSKYNSFINRWDYIDRFTEFYKTLKVEGM